MKVLGRATSGNVQKVLFLLEELKADYSREDYGRQFGNTAGKDYLAMNPTGKVPTLCDGDVILWESNTILRYIANKAQSSLYPTELAQRAQIEIWMDWLLASLNGPYVSIFKATKSGEEVPQAAAKEVAAGLSLLDGQLSKASCLAGENFSLADVCLGPIVHRCINFPVDLPELPNLQRWYSAIKERPAFQTAISG